MTMSFLFGKKHQDNVDYKSRLEYKLYLARENPEPVFDLSECNLKTVPSGIYSLCKVFRKEKLFLQINQLTSLSGGGKFADLSLLTSLHLQYNNLSSLPEDIILLINLQELNVSHNKLCKLPDGIGKLRDVQILDCANNSLRDLPSTVGEMVALTRVDLRHNPVLQFLPCTLGRATRLQQLLVDPDTLLDPPASVSEQGTASILQYLCFKNGTEYLPEQKDTHCEPDQSEDSLQLQGSFQLLEKKKEVKLQELKEVERKIQEKKGREFKLHETIKQDKTKLLLSLIEQQKKTEEDVSQFQIKKEQERTKLLSYLQTVEKQAEETIADLLAVTKAVQSNLSQWQEQELQEQLLLDLKVHTAQLQRNRVIEAMESLLMEEYSRKEKFHAYEKSRADLVHNSLLREVEWSQHISELVNERDVRQTALLSTINADRQLQKTLVATLLERSDLRTQSLLLQTSMVQQQLAALTAAELQSKHQHSVDLLNKLTKKRQQLSEMLVGLLEQQERRQRYLIDKLHQLELTCESSPDYWLWQYQCLLNLRPQLPTTSLEPDLVHQIVAAGVAHCLPFLASCSLSSITSTLLHQIGVKNEEDCATIIRVVEIYLKQREAKFAPSAPPEELPSAPPESPSPTLPECVVCMELECAVVFVPCGHLCACANCAAQLLLCPLCRAQLDRKIHIIIP